jgi:hypothetical protein
MDAPTFKNTFQGAHDSIDFVDLATGDVFRCIAADENQFAVQIASRVAHFTYAIKVATEVAGLLDPGRVAALVAEKERRLDTQRFGVPGTRSLEPRSTELLDTRTHEVVLAELSAVVLTRPRGHVGRLVVTLRSAVL